MNNAERLIEEEDGETERYQLFGPENEASNAADGIEFLLPDEEEQLPAPSMDRFQIFIFAIGHFLNDLCACMWFTYLLVYLEKVVLMNSKPAGFLMLLGQVTDAIATPLVGLLSDASILPSFLIKYGRRKAWHLIGTTCVCLSFPFIFSDCLLCHQNKLDDHQSIWSDWLRALWFTPFIIVFQFGWAATQIAHLALIPELSTDPNKRNSMNSYRNASNVVANLVVFSSLLYILRPSDKKEEDFVGPVDLMYFRLVAIGCVVIGLLVVSIFYIFMKEPPQIRLRPRLSSFSSETTHIVHMSWRCWFSQRNFYLVALLFMLSRLYINMSQVYFPMYIQYTVGLKKIFIAVCPMITYICSFFISCFLGLSQINKRFNRKALFIGGSVVGVGISFIFYFSINNVVTFITAGLLGVVQSLLLISSLSMTAQLINKNTESGAFVYGAMSFLDKLSNGVVIQVIELINPTCGSDKKTETCSQFYRSIMSWTPGTFAILIFFILLFLNAKRLGRRERESGGQSPRDQDANSIATQDMNTEQIEIIG